MVRLEESVSVPMRDGVRLSTDLYFPDRADGRLPVVLVRTPYDKNRWRRETSDARRFAAAGYAVAVQDVRGKFESEGEFTVSAAEPDDGYDTISWLAGQEWSNGRVGTYGCSYLGESQLQLARLRHPAHAAMIAKAAGGAYAGTYRPFGFRCGGAVELATAFSWFRLDGQQGARQELPEIDDDEVLRTLPLLGMVERSGGPQTGFDEFVSREPGDPWWDTLGYVTDRDRFGMPALVVDSWHDGCVAEGLALFDLLRRDSEHAYLVVSPTGHCESENATEQTLVGERDLGDARLDYWSLYERWFDHWLKGRENGIGEMPRARFYVMGRNAWRESEAWPPPDTRLTRWYLGGGGALGLDRPGDGRPDEFVHDPGDPVPSLGDDIEGSGPRDQSEVEARADVLVYTSPVLEHGLEVTGPVRLVLHVSSSARDTDFAARLVDVHPDGRAFNVQTGILRARYRDGFDRSVWMRPGEVYELTIDLHATSNYFAPGHRIRVDVSSSWFPRFDRNLGTGGRNYDETEWVVARNAVHHSRAHPSHLLLPVAG